MKVHELFEENKPDAEYTDLKNRMEDLAEKSGLKEYFKAWQKDVHISRRRVDEFPEYANVWAIRVTLKGPDNPLGKLIDTSSDPDDPAMQKLQKRIGSVAQKFHDTVLAFARGLEHSGKFIGYHMSDLHGFQQGRTNQNSNQWHKPEELEKNMPTGKDFSETLTFYYSETEVDEEHHKKLATKKNGYETLKANVIAVAKEEIKKLKAIKGKEVDGVTVTDVTLFSDFHTWKSNEGTDKLLDPSTIKQDRVDEPGSVHKKLGAVFTMSSGSFFSIGGTIDAGPNFTAYPVYFTTSIDTQKMGPSANEVYGRKFKGSADPLKIFMKQFSDLNDKLEVKKLKLAQKTKRLK